jgi:hypothetical protein
MLEKPDLPDEAIISRLNEEYNLRVAELIFLPLGADLGTAVYRVVTTDGAAYFLKLRKGFEEITVTVPLFLQSLGLQEIIIPFETQSKQRWADFGEYKMILYPFIEGKNGFEMELTDDHKYKLGSVLKAIHSAPVPPELKRHVPKEAFSPQWRDSVRSLQAHAETMSFQDPPAAKLAMFMKSKRSDISRLIQRTEELASELQAKPLALHGFAVSDREDPGRKLARAMKTVGAVPDHHHRVIQYLFNNRRPPDQRLQEARQPRMVLAIELLERRAVSLADPREKLQIAFRSGFRASLPHRSRNFFSCHFRRLLPIRA